MAAASGVGCGEKDDTSSNVCDCEDKQIIKELVEDSAIIIKGCFNYFDQVDSFSIQLLHKPQYEEFYISQELYPCNGIPEQYKVDNLQVLISGKIFDCMKFNGCFVSPDVKLSPVNIMELTSIKGLNQIQTYLNRASSRGMSQSTIIIPVM